jgi:site-specific recombinase XerD
MSHLRQQFIEDMQLSGLAAGTQACYVGAVKRLVRYCGKAPDQISQTELRNYFLYLRNEKQVSRSTFTIALCSIRRFLKKRCAATGTSLTWLVPPEKRNCPSYLVNKRFTVSWPRYVFWPIVLA